jgi:hypothetical protein
MGILLLGVLRGLEVSIAGFSLLGVLSYSTKLLWY